MSIEYREFSRWSITTKDLENITTIKARDLITKCFIEAQKETMHRASQRIGSNASETDIERMVLNLVKSSFKRVDANYNSPSIEDLSLVIGVLARRASAMGTPKDIVEYHKTSIEKVLSALNGK